MRKWKTIEDKYVRHVWTCKDELEHGCLLKGMPAHVAAEAYAEMGTPVCPECGEDMDYVRTEILI